MSDAVDDLATSPWAYPGTTARCSGVLQDGRFTPVPASELLASGRHADERRTAVVAVGSNASPAVMHRKLSRHRVGGGVPLLAGTLVGCAVGHSAHVSLPGFVPATPYLHENARTPVYVTLLDDAQLRCVDATEPNYARRTVPRGRCVLQIEDGTRPHCFDLYDSRWGVLARTDGSAVPFGSQEELHALLRAEWPPYRRLLGDSAEPDALTAAQRVIRALAADADLRQQVSEAFAETGWSRVSGLDRWPEQHLTGSGDEWPEGRPPVRRRR